MLGQVWLPSPEEGGVWPNLRRADDLTIRTPGGWLLSKYCVLRILRAHIFKKKYVQLNYFKTNLSFYLFTWLCWVSVAPTGSALCCSIRTLGCGIQLSAQGLNPGSFH